VHFGAEAVLAVFAFEYAVIFEIKKRLKIVGGHKDYGAAVAAVAAVRAAFRDVFFSPETDAAISAVAGFDRYYGFIYEHNNSPHF
jgi:hypothetical protein